MLSSLAHQEILHLIAEHLASISAPGLPHTLSALKEEMDLRSREEDERESEKERLSGRILGKCSVSSSI